MHSIPLSHIARQKAKNAVVLSLLPVPSTNRRKVPRLKLAKVGVVVRGKVVSNKWARSMSEQVIAHVITLGLHVSAQLVEGRSTDQMALAIDLPCDRSILRAHFIVTSSTSGGSSVHGQVSTLVSINHHTANELAIIVGFVVNNSEDLSLDTNLRRSVGNNSVTAENTVVEGGLVLVHGPAGWRDRASQINQRASKQRMSGSKTHLRQQSGASGFHMSVQPP
jgi:hypothetical protein